MALESYSWITRWLCVIEFVAMVLLQLGDNSTAAAEKAATEEQQRAEKRVGALRTLPVVVHLVFRFPF